MVRRRILDKVWIGQRHVMLLSYVDDADHWWFQLDDVFLKVSNFVITLKMCAASTGYPAYTVRLRGTPFPLLCCHGDRNRRRSVMRRSCSACDAACWHVLERVLLCSLPGQSWVHTAPIELSRGWSSGTAGKDLVSSDLWPLDVSWWFRLWQQFSAAGVKIIGGCKEQSGEQFGIYVKRVVSGGLAALDGRNRDFMNHIAISRKKKEITVLINDCHWRDVCVPGRLKAGDLILDVNNISLVGVTNERWVCCIGLSGCLRSYLQMSPLLIPFHQAVMSLISCPLIGQWRSWGWPPSPITCPYWLREMKNPGEEKKPAWVVSFHADQQFVIAKCSVDSTCALAALPQQGLKLVSRKLLFSKWNHQRSY